MKKILSDESGQTMTLLAALMAFVMIGFVGFAIDVGNLYREKRLVQTAADAAAIAAAGQYTKSGTAVQGSATTAAQFEPGIISSGAKAAVVTATLAGANNSDVIVTIKQPTQTFFMGFFGHSLINVSSMAEAKLQPPPSPLCDHGKNIATCGGGTALTAPKCAIGADDNITAGSANPSLCSSGSGINDGCGILAGGTITTGNDGGSSKNDLETTAGQNCPTSTKPGAPATQVQDPLAGSVTELKNGSNGFDSSKCGPDPGPSGWATYSLGPGASKPPSGSNPPVGQTITIGSNSKPAVCYNSLNIANSDPITLNAGIYIINNGILNLGGGDIVTATGVQFYLMGTASINYANNFTGSLTAPTDGPFPNILIYQELADTQPATFGGGSTGILTGNIYMPNSNITIANDAHLNLNGILDTDQNLVIAGSATVNNTYNPSVSGIPYQPEQIQLVQ